MIVLDPDIAQHIRPGTLRARFGISKVKNAVHCTDLPDDAQLEVGQSRTALSV